MGIFDGVKTPEEVQARIAALPPEDRARLPQIFAKDEALRPVFEELTRRNKEAAEAANRPVPPNPYSIYFNLSDPSRPTTQEDVNKLYENVYNTLESAKTQAEAQGRKLVVLLGDSHSNRSTLAVDAMVATASMELGISDRFGVEIPNESLVGQNWVRRGLDEMMPLINEHAGSGVLLPEKDQYSVLSGVRHNLEFTAVEALRHGAKGVDAVDPNFWEVLRGHDVDHGLYKRDPAMGEAIAAAATDPNNKKGYVALVGADHMVGLERVMRNNPEIAVLKVDAVQSLALPNFFSQTSEGLPNKEDLDNHAESASRSDVRINGGEGLPPSTRFILPGAGFKTSEEAITSVRAAADAHSAKRQLEAQQCAGVDSWAAECSDAQKGERSVDVALFTPEADQPVTSCVVAPPAVVPPIKTVGNGRPR